MIKGLIWTIWTTMSSVLKKADKLNLSLSLSLSATSNNKVIKLTIFYFGESYLLLTHWGRDKIAAIFQTTFQMHFLEWKCKNFDQDFTEVCS